MEEVLKLKKTVDNLRILVCILLGMVLSNIVWVSIILLSTRGD